MTTQEARIHRSLSSAVVGSALLVLSHSADTSPTNPAPSQPRPASVICKGGMATLSANVRNSLSSEQTLTIQGWPNPKAETLSISVVDWDASLSLHSSGAEIKDGNTEVRSERPLLITAKRIEGNAPIKFTVVFFGDAACKLRFPPIEGAM